MRAGVQGAAVSFRRAIWASMIPAHQGVGLGLRGPTLPCLAKGHLPTGAGS